MQITLYCMNGIHCGVSRPLSIFRCISQCKNNGPVITTVQLPPNHRGL